jgi:hypothetical protein
MDLKAIPKKAIKIRPVVIGMGGNKLEEAIKFSLEALHFVY